MNTDAKYLLVSKEAIRAMHIKEVKREYIGLPFDYDDVTVSGNPLDPLKDFSLEELEVLRDNITKLMAEKYERQVKQEAEEWFKNNKNDIHVKDMYPPLIINPYKIPDNLKHVTLDEVAGEYTKADVELLEKMLKMSSNSSYGVPANPNYYKFYVGARGGGKSLWGMLANNVSIQEADELYLKNIWINEDKKLITTKNDDGDIVKVQCSEEDEFDPYVGVALALAYKQFGSKSKFRRAVVNKVLNTKTKKKGSK